MSKPIKIALQALLLSSLLAGSAFAQDAGDQSGAASPAPAAPLPRPFYGSITVTKGDGKLVHIPHAASNIFSADPTIVEVRPASPTALFVFGVGPGETTIEATDAQGNPIAHYTVVVAPSSYPGDRLQNEAASSAPGSGNMPGHAASTASECQRTHQVKRMGVRWMNVTAVWRLSWKTSALRRARTLQPRGPLLRANIIAKAALPST